jgi:4-alpha-glucanotransferase
MEGWSLPPDAALRLIHLERDLGEARISGPDGPLIRGAHWRNFLVKYSESNRMHKKMQALSLQLREAGDPPLARRAIGRAQCNDAYWHGVFGGLYLPHLREAIWRNLALAERELRRGQRLTAEVWDIDGDGHEEIWVHSDRSSAIVSPWRGGALEEYTLFSTATNYANTLTRRREAYHDTALEQRAETGSYEDGTPSIHDIEAGIRLDQRPPSDADDRALFVDRVVSSSLQREQYASGDYWPVKSWARCRYIGDVRHEPDAVEVRMVGEGLAKQYRFLPDGSITVSYTWEGSVGQPTDLFTTELSLFAPLPLVTDPAADIWTYPIETVAKSERGLDRTRQGESVTLRWPVETGAATVELSATHTQSLEPAVAANTAG